MEADAKRKRKSLEERLADIDAKIARKKKDLADLEARREKILHPGPTMRAVMRKAEQKGLTPREIEKLLGLEDVILDEDDGDTDDSTDTTSSAAPAAAPDVAGPVTGADTVTVTVPADPAAGAAPAPAPAPAPESGAAAV